MKLFDRVSTLLKADAHGALESLEDRTLLLKQHTREAELALDRKRVRLESLREECRRLGDAAQRCDAETQALDEDIALALTAGKDDLARFAIRRLLPRRQKASALRATLAQRGVEVEALSLQIAAQQAQYEDLRARVRAALERAPAQDDIVLVRGCEPAVHDEEIEIELMRRRQVAAGGRG